MGSNSGADLNSFHYVRQNYYTSEGESGAESQGSMAVKPDGKQKIVRNTLEDLLSVGSGAFR